MSAIERHLTTGYLPLLDLTPRPHCDCGCFTVLDRELGVAGLQIQTLDGEWIDAPRVPGFVHHQRRRQVVVGRDDQSGSPMSSFHSDGCSAMNSSIISTHSCESRLITSTPCSRRRSSAPTNVRFSPITTRLMP